MCICQTNTRTIWNYIEIEGVVNMGGMCSDRICYLFWFYLYNYQFWMFKIYGKYKLWLDMFVVGQVLDVCGWTCVGCVGSLWCMNNIQFNNIKFGVYSY
ncbi:structural maintenance of chromosomes protein 4 [Iris pallida]|uniref:Structural maintenance of chromosomes protein 4 n=1 Tax=Iris pallida TaxID=29817 RepID=A0AAX6EE88_IRIPA|nr:structural maintenance of chromosomes protein 4 [Iris pallida]